ncbi:MAG: hypothetical protein HOP33_01445 [Verrucomicrobia bacterium]|nr:hypothetical protein [Verrucomicrobiota bacterium]
MSVWSVSPGDAGPLLPPVQVGNFLKMTNGNVRLEYDLSTGRADFLWQNSRKIAGFYAGFGLYDSGVLTNYVTGPVYTNRSWTVTSNTVEVISTSGGLPTMKQVFILANDDSFLTRLEVVGNGLQSRWMGPVVMDQVGGVDLGSANDNRALTVPFDNDSFTFSYNAMPINNTSTSYEVGAFYDNTSRNGLVVGSVTHDTWKTGVYFQGANNKLNVLNVYGGVTSSDTRDVEPHGLVKGNTISSPTVFVGFGSDWRTVMEAYGDTNAAIAPKLTWNGSVPFGWNSWYAYTSGVNLSNASAASWFIKTNLQSNHFHNQGVAYINLDSYWDNFSDAQLVQFTSLCHSNGQRAGIYHSPFVYWGTAPQGSNTFMTGSGTYRWSHAYLRAPNGDILSHNGAIALDPTHPGVKQMTAYLMNYFRTRGFDYLKMDFLSHGAIEGVHYDTNVTTGIQAFNQGMQYLVTQNNGRMFLSASIAPLFPYRYAHSRRIYCDAASSINDTHDTMQAVNYGWWLHGRLYQFNDPDMMKFAGATANENQSRLINCAISGTVFLNSDDLASSAGQALAQNCLTRASINEVARAGISFRPVEGNTGANASDVFVRQDGGTWYVAVFNYNTIFSATKNLNLARLGISGTYTAVDLWSGAVSTVSGTAWSVSLGAKQAKLFRLGSGSTSATGPTNQTLVVGSPATFTTVASGTPPFSYVWKKNGTTVAGQNANTISFNPANLSDAGVYSVVVTGGSGSVTNSAVLSTNLSPVKWAVGNADWLSPGAWKDFSGSNAVYYDGTAVVLDDTASGVSPIVVTASQWMSPASLTASNVSKDYKIVGSGGISGGATALTKTGAGKLILATDNDYTGSTTINAGSLQIGDGGTSGRIGGGSVTNNATLVFNRSDTYAPPSFLGGYPALRGGPGTLKQIGSGKLVFADQYVFGIWVSNPNQGLYVGPGSTAETTSYNPVGAVTLEGGILSSSGGNSASYQSWVLSGGVTVLSNAQTSVITNNSMVNEFSQIELRDSTVFNVTQGATNGIDLLVPAVLTHSYWEYGNWGTLVKTGNGTMLLTAANLFQGEAIISGGTLLLNSPGSIGASGFPVTVQSGGHFGGTGTINRNVSVQSGGFLEPGAGGLNLGTLTVNGNLTLAGTTAMQLNRANSPSNDVIVVVNALAFGSTLTVSNTGPALVAGNSFKLFSKPGTGTFSTVTLPALGAGLAWTNKLATDGSIAVMQTVNLTPTNIDLEWNSTSLTLNWPADHTGWRLQSQTNNLNTGLGTNWWNVAGAEATNRWSVPVNTINQSVFFRLIFP